MISQTLREARKYEEIEEKKIPSDERPAFHLSPRIGWMNDPNGFSYYNGKYHMFYQYHPYDSNWGPMHWGHAVSEDLLSWEYLPVALAPDSLQDSIGCFSGSAVTTEDGKHLLIYTGVHKKKMPGGEEVDVQEQCVAIGDGVDYEKLSSNPVIRSEQLPSGCSQFDFRDPKIWKLEDGSYQCVVGNCTEEKDGQLVLFESKNGLEWKFVRILEKNNGRYGKMWECPDFFEMDGKKIVITSPQEMLPKGFEYHNGNGTLCQIGHLDENGIFVEEENQTLDYGIDFYAPQTMLAPDGRRIMVGWLQNWDTCPHNGKEVLWFGQLSLPRELTMKNGRIYSNPVRELEAFRKNKVVYRDIAVTDGLKLEGIEGRCLDMTIRLRSGDVEKLYQKFAVRFAKNEEFHTAVSFRPHESIVKVDRKFSGSRRATIHQRRCQVCDDQKDGSISLRIILDRFSAEVFINDGIQAMSIAIQTPVEAKEIAFCADGDVLMDIEKYELKTPVRK